MSMDDNVKNELGLCTINLIHLVDNFFSFWNPHLLFIKCRFGL